MDSTCRGALSHGYDLVLVADGHSTPERADGVVPSAAQVIAHHNATFGVIRYAGRTTAVVPAEQIRFDAACSPGARRGTTVEPGYGRSAHGGAA